MNRKYIFLLMTALLLAVFFVFTSCKKDDDSDFPTGQPEYSQKRPEYVESEEEEDPIAIEDLATVKACYYQDIMDNYIYFEEFIVDESSSSAKVAFIAEGEVRDFKVLLLEKEGEDENGEMMYSEIELYRIDMLYPLKPLIVTLSFKDEYTVYGVSYVDESGSVRSFALEESKDDGSLLLNEF